MAQNDAITFFPEIERVCRKLNNEQFGVLIRAVIAYRLRGEVYIGDDVRVDACFEFLSNQVDREDAAKAKKAKAAASRWDKEQMHRDAEACTPMHRDAEACTPMHRDANDAPIPSNPIPSYPVPSDPIPSHPIQNVNSLSDEREYRRGGAGSLPGKAKKEAFGKLAG